MIIYIDGKEVGANAGGARNTAVPIKERKFSYIGRSNWA